MGEYQVASLASLSAVSWDYDNKNLKIRLFSLNSDSTAVLQMSYSQREGGWDDDHKETNQPAVTSNGENSALASIRNPKDGSISVFWQPERKVIGLYAATPETRIPLGIPTTGLTKNEQLRAAAAAKKRKDVADALIKDEEDKKQTKLKTMGVCPSGYTWIKEAGGYRCSAGGHFISDAELAAKA
jgi:hypothetical protein